MFWGCFSWFLLDFTESVISLEYYFFTHLFHNLLCHFAGESACDNSMEIAGETSVSRVRLWNIFILPSCNCRCPVGAGTSATAVLTTHLDKKIKFCLAINDFYTRVWKTGRIMPWQCPSVRLSVRLSVRPSVRPCFPDFSSTCFEISIWNLVYTFSRWHNMSSLSCITIGSLWPSLQPKVGQTYFLQSRPHKSR